MAEVRERAGTTGLKGGGGSSLGYAMAGYEVVAACEFVAAARATYMRNFPTTPILSDDLRQVQPEQILELADLRRGELDVLDGSPPCSAFSELVRKNVTREERWGEDVKYSDTSQRTDDLFFEFVRLLDGLQPRAFVAENVRALVMGKAKAYFVEILARMKACGYRVTARMLDAQYLGVPQQRPRIIFVGVREDQPFEPEHPAPFRYRHTLREALAGLPPEPEAEAAASFEGYAIEKVWRGLSSGEHRKDKYFGLYRSSWARPANAVTASSGLIGGAALSHPDFPRKFTVAELKRICSFPDDFVLEGTYQQQVERMGRAVPPLMMKAIAGHLAGRLLSAA